jgi:hypothetical protein
VPTNRNGDPGLAGTFLLDRFDGSEETNMSETVPYDEAEPGERQIEGEVTLRG